MDIDVHDLEYSDKKSRLENIRTAIRNIVYSNKKDILFNDPLYGTDLKGFIGKPLDAYTGNSIRKQIESSIRIYEKRVKDVKVVVSSNMEFHSLIIDVYFTDKTTEETNTLRLNYK